MSQCLRAAVLLAAARRRRMALRFSALRRITYRSEIERIFGSGLADQ
jgi:hypothetical protein